MHCAPLPSMPAAGSMSKAAGKTTILYKLKLGEVVTTIPTIGFNVGWLRRKTCLRELAGRLDVEDVGTQLAGH